MKCWLRAGGEVSTANAYVEWVKTQDGSYRANETARLVRESASNEVAALLAIENLRSVRWQFATSVPAQAQINSYSVESCLDAVERMPSDNWGKPARLIPLRFIFRNKLTKDDKLLLGFDAFVLSETLGREISLGKIIHGDGHVCLRVKASPLADEVRKCLEKIAALLSNSTPPDLALNRHCAECEFRNRCYQKALETDDLSLLAGVSARERQKLHSKGIFSVTQLSYTFRPRRRPKRLRDKREKYHHALKALAIREKKIHIAGSPELKIGGSPVYLDVEGLSSTRPDNPPVRQQLMIEACSAKVPKPANTWAWTFWISSAQVKRIFTLSPRAGAVVGNVQAALRELNLELAAKGESSLFQKLKRHGRFVLSEQAVECCAVGFHAAGEFGAGNFAALHLALNLPGNDALERARFALGEQTVLLEEVVEFRTDVLLFHSATVADAGGSSPVPNLLAASSAIS